MTSDSLSGAEVASLLSRSARDLRAAVSELDALDAQIGDGDLGSSAATLFEDALDDLGLPTTSAGHLLKAFGDSLMRRCSGASGTLYAVLFTALGTELEDVNTLSLGNLAQGFRRGVEMVKQLGGASPGDATMIDAMEPFVHALEEQAIVGGSLRGALRRAAEAAELGAASTANLVARLGRARGFGDRTIGHVDPGARSFAIIVNAWKG